MHVFDTAAGVMAPTQRGSLRCTHQRQCVFRILNSPVEHSRADSQNLPPQSNRKPGQPCKPRSGGSQQWAAGASSLHVWLHLWMGPFDGILLNEVLSHPIHTSKQLHILVLTVTTIFAPDT